MSVAPEILESRVADTLSARTPHLVVPRRDRRQWREHGPVGDVTVTRTLPTLPGRMILREDVVILARKGCCSSPTYAVRAGELWVGACHRHAVRVPMVDRRAIRPVS